jgi:hypothetical protein
LPGVGTAVAKLHPGNAQQQEQAMHGSSYRRNDWETRMRSLMRDERRCPWIVFAIGFVLGAWIF